MLDEDEQIAEDLRHGVDDCPLRQLVSFYENGERPPLRWAVEWCPDGTLDRVWREASDIDAMVGLLVKLGRIGENLTRHLRCEKYHQNRAENGLDHSVEADDYCRVDLDGFDTCYRCMQIARKFFSRPPTLRQIELAYLG